MNNVRLIVFSAIFILLAILFSCSTEQLAGGTDTETGGSKIAGIIKTADGYPAAQTAVTLIPSDYNPVIYGTLPESLTVITDTNGAYCINVQTRGLYNIHAVNILSRNRLLLYGINYTGENVTVQPAGLSQPGSLRFILPEGIDRASGFIFISGTTIMLPLKNIGTSVVLDSVPSGTIPVVMYLDTVSKQQQILSSNVHVISGASSIIANPSWAFTRKIYLNTTSSGANVMGTVTGFPVLVRLTTNNFQFAQAQRGGNDIRFTQHDSILVPYEIERWDSANGAAEIWVKVDTIHGNDSTQSITMYWGNPAASSKSDGGAVFDTVNGFQGVWHLGGSENANASDATLHHYDGTPTDTAPQTTTGIIGSALQFDGKSNGITMKNTANSPLNFSRPGTYTFSAWIYVDTVYDADEFIAGKGYDQYSLRVKGIQSMPSNSFALHEYINGPTYGTEMRLAPVVTRQWKYVVGIRDTAKSYLFIDGTCADSSGASFYAKLDVQDNANFSIGRCAASFATSATNNEYLVFKGKIDEVRIAKVACAADWVKLSYVNQKQQDALIKW